MIDQDPSSSGAAPVAESVSVSESLSASESTSGSASAPRRKRRTTLPGFPAPSRGRRNLKHRVHQLLRVVEHRAVHSPRRRVRFSLYLVRLAVQVVRQWARDHCPQQAASLAFQTVLSVVPLLALGLAALRTTGLMEEESAFVAFLSSKLIPVSSSDIAARLTEWSDNISFQSLGLVGLVATVIIAFVTWHSLEQILNHIWRAERRRSLPQKFVIFYATITLGPFLLGVSLYQAARFGISEGGSGVLLSVASSYLALFLTNWILPATRVRIGPAAIGAAVTTVLFEVAKHLFALYVSGFAFERYSGIYGALAVVPFWLIWIYWSWLMLLLGAEVAHAAQNIRLLEQSERRGALSLENELLERVNGPMAARIMVAIAAAYQAGTRGLSRQQIADRFDLSADVVDRLVGRLKGADLLVEVDGDFAGLMPSRPPSELSLAGVLAAFRSEDQSSQRLRQTTLGNLLAEIETDTLSRTSQVSLAQLVDRRM